MEVVLSRGLRVLKVKEKISIYISNIVEITKKKKKKERTRRTEPASRQKGDVKLICAVFSAWSTLSFL